MTTPRLSAATVPDAAARRPAYDRAAVTAGVVHLGLGAFSRAHVAVYLDDMLAQGHSALGIVGVSLRNRDVPDALAPMVMVVMSIVYAAVAYPAGSAARNAAVRCPPPGTARMRNGARIPSRVRRTRPVAAVALWHALRPRAHGSCA